MEQLHEILNLIGCLKDNIIHSCLGCNQATSSGNMLWLLRLNPLVKYLANMLWLRNKKYLFTFIWTPLFSLLPGLGAELSYQFNPSNFRVKSCFLMATTFCKMVFIQPLALQCSKNQGGVKSCLRVCWHEGTSLHTCAGDLCMVCVPQHPSGHLGRSSGLRYYLLLRINQRFILSREKLGRVTRCWGLLSSCWFCPAGGGTLPAPAVISSLSQHRMLLLGLEYGHANFIFSLN